MTDMKSHAARLLRMVAETRRPIVITQSGEPKGVLMDFDSFQDLREATLLLKLVAQGEADVRAGRVATQSEVFARAKKRFRQG